MKFSSMKKAMIGTGVVLLIGCPFAGSEEGTNNAGGNETIKKTMSIAYGRILARTCEWVPSSSMLCPKKTPPPPVGRVRAMWNYFGMEKKKKEKPSRLSSVIMTATAWFTKPKPPPTKYQVVTTTIRKFASTMIDHANRVWNVPISLDHVTDLLVRYNVPTTWLFGTKPKPPPPTRMQVITTAIRTFLLKTKLPPIEDSFDVLFFGILVFAVEYLLGCLCTFFFGMIVYGVKYLHCLRTYGRTTQRATIEPPTVTTATTTTTAPTIIATEEPSMCIDETEADDESTTITTTTTTTADSVDLEVPEPEAEIVQPATKPAVKSSLQQAADLLCPAAEEEISTSSSQQTAPLLLHEPGSSSSSQTLAVEAEPHLNCYARRLLRRKKEREAKLAQEQQERKADGPLEVVQLEPPHCGDGNIGDSISHGSGDNDDDDRQPDRPRDAPCASPTSSMAPTLLSTDRGPIIVGAQPRQESEVVESSSGSPPRKKKNRNSRRRGPGRGNRQKQQQHQPLPEP